MWYLSGPGIEPMSLALAGRFLTTGPPEKPTIKYLDCGGGCMKLYLRKNCRQLYTVGRPIGSDSKESAMHETRFDPWIRKVP